MLNTSNGSRVQNLKPKNNIGGKIVWRRGEKNTRKQECKK